MNIPVDRDGGECEAAGVHGEVDKEVDHFAHEGAKHPVFQGVDGGLERDAEDDEEEVSHAQVEDEQIGGVVSHLAAPQKHSQHQAVANGAQKEDQGENHRHNHTGGVQLVAFRNVRLPSWLTEILKVRHVASLEVWKRGWKRMHVSKIIFITQLDHKTVSLHFSIQYYSPGLMH